MKQIFLTLLLTLNFTVAFASTAVETALVNDTSYQLAGTFGQYDFPDSSDAFDWAFTASGGTSYQLQGNPPSANDVFGWKAVSNITTPAPLWYMFRLHSDIDGDGTGRFNWILLSADMNNKAAYKLAGVSDTGTFTYSNKLNIDYKLEGTSITTGAPGAFSNESLLKKKTPWKFNVTYTSSNGNGSMSIENLFINCTDPSTALCTFIGNDYTYYNDETSIKYNTLAYDSDAAPLVIDAGHLYWSARLTSKSTVYSIGSDYIATVTHCYSAIPSAQLNNLKNGMSMHWESPSTSTTAQCTYTLEPMQ